jgi:hypothetical protein
VKERPITMRLMVSKAKAEIAALSINAYFDAKSSKMGFTLRGGAKIKNHLICVTHRKG